MSSVIIPEAKNTLRPEQVTVQRLLIENGQLIETAAEYQRMGRIEDATKYQELLHRNLIYLAKLADSSYTSHLLQELGGVQAAQAVREQQPAAMPSSVSPPTVPPHQLSHTSPPQLLVPPPVAQQQPQHPSPSLQPPPLAVAAVATSPSKSQQSPSYQRAGPAPPAMQHPLTHPAMSAFQQHQPPPQQQIPPPQHHLMMYPGHAGPSAPQHHYAPISVTYGQPHVMQFVPQQQQYQMGSVQPPAAGYPSASSQQQQQSDPRTHGYQ